MANVDGFADEIAKAIAEYSEEVDNKMKSVIDEVSKETFANIKSNPIIPVKTGKYKKSFRLKKTADGMGYRRYTLYNTRGQLTQLLEYGHLIWTSDKEKGKRRKVSVMKEAQQKKFHAKNTGKRTKAFPHWEQAEEIALKLPDKIKEAIEH